MDLYAFIADGLRRNVPDALAAHLTERVWVAEDLASGIGSDAYQAELPDMARRLNDMCR